MRLSRLIFILLFVLLMLAQGAKDHYEKPVIGRSEMNERFEQGGLLEGLDPNDEILSKRTRMSKKFRIADDRIRVVIGPEFHYQDENGLWQDIDTDIEDTGDFNTPYRNEKNSVKSYYAMDHRQGIEIVVDDVSMHTGLSHNMFSGTWKPEKTSLSSLAQSIGNIVRYPDVWDGIDIEYHVQPSIIEHNVIFESPGIFNEMDENLVLTERVKLPTGATLQGLYGTAGEDLLEVTSQSYVLLDGDTLFGLLPSRIYDAAYDGNVYDPTSAGELEIPENFQYTKTFVRRIEGDTYEFRTIVERGWLLAVDREWPVTLDPTVGPIPEGWNAGGYMYPWQTGYQQRSTQCLYLQSDIGYAGDIDRIAYQQSAANGQSNTNTRIQMKHSSTSSFSTPLFETSGWTTCHNYATLYYTSGTGWRWIDLSTDFAYNNTNNLQIETRFYNSSASAYGGWYHRGVAPYYGHKWGYGNNNNYPPDNQTYGSNIPYLQIDIADAPTDHCYDCPSYDHGTYYPSTSWNTHSDSFLDGYCRMYRFYLYSGNPYTFTTGCDGGSSADFDTRIYLYNSSCTQVAFNDDACGLQSQIDYTPGSSGYYYLKVEGYGGAGGSYTLAYKYTSVPTDHCYDPPSDYDFSRTIYSYWSTHSDDFDADGCRVYRFYMYDDRAYDFTCCSSDGAGGSGTTGDIDFRMYNSSGTQQWYIDGSSSCSYDATTIGSSYEAWTPSSDGYYYLKVEEYYDSNADYTLAYRYQVPCETPGTPTTYSPTDVTTDGANFSWSAGSPAGDPTVTYYWAVGTSSGVTYESGYTVRGSTTGTTASTSSLSEDTGYYFNVRACTSCDGSCSSYGTARYFQTGYCHDCPTYDYGTYYPSPSWAIHSTSFDDDECIIYRFYLYSGTEYSFTTGCDGGSTADFDTYLELYNSGCSMVASNDDACGLQSQIDYECVSTGYYYLKVRGFSSTSSGSYTLAYRENPCETPGTPTVNAPTGVTETTASFSWAAGSPVGDPTVTYYWAVGTSSGVTYESGYIDRGTTTGTTAFTSSLSASTGYYITVKACTSCDGTCSSYATPYYFSTTGSTCSAPSSVSASSDVSSVCYEGTVTFQYVSHSGGDCSGSWQYEWRNGLGTPVRPWSTTSNYTTTLTADATYYLYMRCSDCTGDVSPASGAVTIDVYNDVALGTWTGYEDDEWTNPQNWGRCTAPTISTNVTIPNTPLYGRFPKVNTADGSCVCHDLTNDGTVNGGAGNRLYVHGDFMNNGTFNRETGVIIFDGGDAEQHIGGINPTSFYDVEVNKTSGSVVLDRDITVYENLNMLYPGPHRVMLYPYQITFIP